VVDALYNWPFVLNLLQIDTGDDNVDEACDADDNDGLSGAMEGVGHKPDPTPLLRTA